MAKTRPLTGGTPEPAPAARRRGDPPRAVGDPRPRRGARPRARARLDHRRRGAGLARPAPRHRLRAAARRGQHPRGGARRSAATAPSSAGWSPTGSTCASRPSSRFEADTRFDQMDRTRELLRSPAGPPRPRGLTPAMARRARGRPVHGWLIVDKPAGPDLGRRRRQGEVGARRARRPATPARSTRPPPACSRIAFGEATKTVPFVADARKAYRFTVRWGAATATDDAEGAVLATSRRAPGRRRRSAPRCRPSPATSCRSRRRSRRSRSTARAPTTSPAPARRSTSRRGRCTSSGWSSSRRPTATPPSSRWSAARAATCAASPATSARALGCLGHVAALRRLWSGPFDLDGAVDWPTLEAEARTPALAARLLPVAGGARRAARARLPAAGRGAAAATATRWRCRRRASPRAPPPGRAATACRSRSAPGAAARCTRRASSCSADARACAARRGSAPRVEPRALAALLAVAACVWAFVGLADEVAEGETHGFDTRAPARAAQPRRPGRPARPRLGRGARPRRHRARRPRHPRRADPRRRPASSGCRATGARCG